MKSACLFFLVLFTCPSCRQANTEENVAKVAVQTPVIKAAAKQTGAKQINIPGTRLFITPPDGFQLSGSLIGLMRDDGAAIQVMDLMSGNFYKNAATFSQQEFEARGVTVFDYQETIVDGFPAKYVFLQGDPSVKSCHLVFGDSTFSTSVTAFFSPDDEALAAQMKQTLLSVRYQKKLKVDPFATAPFILDDRQSPCKFTIFSGNMYIYSRGGAASKEKDAPVVMVIPIPRDADATPASIAETTSASREQYGLTDKVVKNINTAKVNGYDAYESEIYGNQKGKKALFYELIVVKDNKSVVVQGIIAKDFATTLKSVRSFARTIHFK